MKPNGRVQEFSGCPGWLVQSERCPNRPRLWVRSMARAHSSQPMNAQISEIQISVSLSLKSINKFKRKRALKLFPIETQKVDDTRMCDTPPRTSSGSHTVSSQSPTSMTLSSGLESTLQHKQARKWASNSWEDLDSVARISIRSSARWLRARTTFREWPLVTDRTWLQILVVTISSYVTLSKFIYLPEPHFL